MFNKRKSLLLGILAAATATGLALGVNGVVDAYVGEPVEVSAADLKSETCSCPAIEPVSGTITYEMNNFTVTQEKGTSKNDVLAKTPWRIYVGHKFTIQSKFETVLIDHIVFSSGDEDRDYWTPNVSSVTGGTLMTSGNTATFTAEEGGTSVFSVSPKKQWRIASFEIFYTEAGSVPVTSVEVTSESDTIYEDASLQMTATVNEDATNKSVDWSVEPADYASIDDDGILTGLKAGEVTVTATAADGSGVTGSKTITILEDPIEDFELVSGSPAVQYAGQPFDSTGLVFEATYLGKGTLTVDHSSIVFAPETIQKDTTEVTATFDGKTIVIPVEVSNVQKYYFGTHEDFLDKWDSSYAERKLEYDNFEIVFESADKQSQNITDCPVTKGKSATLTANDGYLIKSVEFGFKQWTTKTQNTDLLVSNDGISFGNAVASIDFPSDGTSISYADEAGFKAVKVSHSNSNQIGWEYVVLELIEDTGASDFANTFLGEKLCDDGLTAPSIETWNTLAASFNEISAASKETFKTAVANVAGTEIEQCVARYDYIVGKYGAETYNDFMGRKPAPIASALSIHSSDEAMDVAIISALAVAGIAAAGAFVFLRRKKEA